MSLSNDERQALVELKNQGYSFDEAMGFIATSRTGNRSRIERDLMQEDTPEVDNSAAADLSRGFEGAKQALNEGMDRDIAIEQQGRGRISELFGKFTSGTRAAGEAIGSITVGALRALPGGTTAIDAISGATQKAAEEVTQSGAFQAAQRGFRSLPPGVQQTLGDVGNLGMGALGIAEPLVAPGATRALATGIREFAKAGIKDVGEKGIQSAVRTGLEPEALMQRVARISKFKQAAFEKRAGESVGEYLVNRGIFGDPKSITEQLYARMQTSKGRVDTGLAQVGGTYKNDTVQDALEQLAEREARVSSTRTPSADTPRVTELLNKHQRSGLTLSEVNEVKRLYERNIKLDFLRGNVGDGITKANHIDNLLRQFVEDTAADNGFANVRTLNKETSLAKQLLDDLGAEFKGKKGNNFASLSDAMFLAEATSNPTALAAFGLKKFFASESTMSAVARLMARKREVRGLPSGERTQPLALPAAPEGAPRSSIESGAPIQAGGMTDRGVVQPGITERVSENAIRRSDSEPIEPIAMRGENARRQSLAEIEIEMLEFSQAGYRMPILEDGYTVGFKGVPSTFPKWIPENLRNSDLFARVWRNINENRQPRANATQEIELQKIVQEKIDKRIDEILDAPEKDLGIFDNNVPFGLALAGSGAYFLYSEDGSLVPVLAIGMMSPTIRSAAIRNVEDHAKTLRYKISVMEDAGKTNTAAYKKLIAAHDSAIGKKLELQRATSSQ